MNISPIEMKIPIDDYDNDMEGIIGRLLHICPKLIMDYDPDMFFWMLVSGFIDFPENSSPSYYSSGQRMISLIEAAMISEPGTTILVDEPELSLHIDWQRRFIDRFVSFNKKSGNSHSPDIIYNHTEKVVEVPLRVRRFEIGIQYQHLVDAVSDPEENFQKPQFVNLETQ